MSSLTTGAMSSGEYAFTFTYKDRDQAYESNAPTESTITLTGSSGSVTVVVPNSTDAQVDAIVVYARKVSAGETVARKVSSLAQSGGVSSTLVVTSTWGAETATRTVHFDAGAHVYANWETDVRPIFSASCNSCHGSFPDGGPSKLNTEDKWLAKYAEPALAS